MRLPRALWLVLLTGACAMQPPEGGTPDAFDLALGDAYQILAEVERAEFDWRDSDTFFARAAAARAGVSPPPEDLANRDLDEAALAELAPARDDLVAVLEGGGRLLAPEAAAAAQAAFDCWAQEAEEAHQEVDIAACRARLTEAQKEAADALQSSLVVLLPAKADKAQGAVVVGGAGEAAVTLGEPYAAAVAAEAALTDAGEVNRTEVDRLLSSALKTEPNPQRSYLIYFQTGGGEITPESSASLAAAIEDALSSPLTRVSVFGHTDTVGAASVNARIAVRRADTIAEEMTTAGVPPDRISTDSFGEAALLVPTPDNTPEPRNRRVEIAVR